ncbi:MAG TPA: helix-turn-helix domain-containing protein [Kofleriaceae bacterium]|jgi:AraC-like DNA-binding protein
MPFGDNPVGKHVVGRRFVVWCAAPDLIGSIHWGVADDADIRELMAVTDVIGHPDLAPQQRLLIDAHAIERVDADVMMGAVAQMRQHYARWAPAVERQAVIIPDNLTGVLLAAPLPILGPPYPFRYAATADDALAFIDHPAAAAAYRAMAAIARDAGAGAGLVERLRAAMSRDLVAITVARAAAALVMSERSLQRELQLAGTSFSDELRRARVATAVELLRLDRETKVEAIAMRVGFGSASRLAVALRRELGVTAVALRPK